MKGKEDEKVIEAIKVIMEYCGDREVNCSNCVLNPENGDLCNMYFFKIPEDWDVKICKNAK